MLNSINLLNFKSRFQTNNNKTNQQARFNFNVTAPKLAPLNQDTINFTGGKYDSDIDMWKDILSDPEICQGLHDKAKPAKDYMDQILEKHFSGLVYDKEKNPNGVIGQPKARVKSAGSIGEKVVNRLRSTLKQTDKDLDEKNNSSGNSVKDDQKALILPRSERSIKSSIRDISGARIVVRESDPHNMDVIVENLCKMIQDESLIIDEIENHTSPIEGVEPYFSKEQLAKVAKVVNKVRSENDLPAIEVKPNETPSGYMALHLSVDTTTVSKNKKFQGFYSELQILGSDVEKLKDIEDLCYKLKKKMSIKEKDGAYEFFKDMFNGAYFDSEGEPIPEISEAFDEYTLKAYEIQRRRHGNKSVADDVNSWNYKYPSLEDCGLENELPAILDFNVLARIKRSCDDLYRVEHETDKILKDMNKRKIAFANS